MQMPIENLLKRDDLWRGRSSGAPEKESLPSGFAELDALLPGGGWPAGAFTELVPSRHGLGELSLLMPALEKLRLRRAGSRIASNSVTYRSSSVSSQRKTLSCLRISSRPALALTRERR